MILASAENVLWLPLGDSITWGCGTDAVPRGGAACAKDAGAVRDPHRSHYLPALLGIQNSIETDVQTMLMHRQE